MCFIYFIIFKITAIMQAQNQDCLSALKIQEVKAFLRLRTLGTMETDASELTQEEESYLFNLLQKLQSQSNMDFRGLWGIMSLGFQNRSGLVLMTMFNNTTVNYSQILKKKGFLKEIQVLQNPNLSIESIRRILQILNIQKKFFIQKFQEQKDLIRKILITQKLLQKPIYTTKEKILSDDDYDSDPGTQFFHDIRQIQQQQTIFRRLSFFQQNNHFQAEESVQQVGQQTITMKRLINLKKASRKKRRKGKRPDPKSKKSKMIKQIKNKEAQFVNFVSKRREQSRLRFAYDIIHNFDNNQSQNEPQTPRRNRVMRENQPTSRKKRRKAQNMDNELSQEMLDEEQQSEQQVIVFPSHGDEYYQLDSDDRMQQQKAARKPKKLRHIQPSSKTQTENQNRHDNYPNLPFNNNNNNNNNKNAVQLQHRPTTTQLTTQPIAPIVAANHNENIQNLKIRKMQFVTSYQGLLAMGVVDETDRYLFMTNQFRQTLLAMTRKEQFRCIKQIVRSKNGIEFQNFVRLIQMGRNQVMSQYVKAYINPILQYKLVKIYAQLINEIVKIMFSSTSSQMSQQLAKKSKLFIVLMEYARKQNQSQYYISIFVECLKSIVQNLNNKLQITQSLVQLPKPFQIIKQQIRIKLKQQQQFIECIILSVFIISQSFLPALLKVQHNGKQLSVIHKQILLYFSTKMKNKTKFLKQLSQIYMFFNLPITNNQQFQAVLQFFKYLDLQQNHPEQCYELVPILVKSFIRQKLQKDNKVNFKPMLNYIITKNIIQKCRKSPKPQAQYLLLRVYETLLQFPIFHNELTVRQILPFLKQINLQQKHSEKSLTILSKMLIKCYQIMIKKSNKSLQQLKQQISNPPSSQIFNPIIQIEHLIQNLVALSLEKSSRFSNANSNYTSLCHDHNDHNDNVNEIVENTTTIKYRNVIGLCLDQLVLSSMQFKHIQYHVFVFHLLVKQIFTPLNDIFKTNIPNNQFAITISRLVIKYVYSIQEFFINYISIHQGSIQKDKDKDKDTAILDEEEQMEMLLNKQKRKIQNAKIYLEIIRMIIEKSQSRQNLQCCNFLSMNPAKNYLFYQLQGINSAFMLFSNPNLNRIKVQIIGSFEDHVKTINVVKVDNFYTTSNRLMLDYFKGFFSTLEIFFRMGPNNIDLDQSVKQKILDIMFFSIALQRDSNLAFQLIKIAVKIPIFRSYNHMLTKYQFDNFRIEYGATSYLQQFYRIVLERKDLLDHRMIQKFRNQYYQPLKTLWKSCHQLKIMTAIQSTIGISLLQTLIFLIKLNPNPNLSQQLLKNYKQSIILYDDKIPQNNHNPNPNIIKCLQQKQSSLRNGNLIQKYMIDLFRAVAHHNILKNRQDMQNCKNNYMKFLVNLTLKMKEDHRCHEIKFTKIRNFVQAVHNQCESKSDEFSQQLCEYILQHLLSNSLIFQSLKEVVVHFFFTLFKPFPKLNFSLLKVLKDNHEKIDKIIRTRKILQLTNCQNLEDAIRKYILSQNCDFNLLYSIIWYRIKQAQKRKQKVVLTQLSQIVIKCILFIEGKQQQMDELAGRFRQLQKCIWEQEVRINNGRIGFQRIIHL